MRFAPMLHAALILTAAMFLIAPNAGANVPSWSTMPALSQFMPNLERYNAVAEAYWAAVPGVRTIDEACPVGRRQMLLTADAGIGGAAHAHTSYVDESPRVPCEMWFEEKYLTQLRSPGPWAPAQADQLACWAIVHEWGHWLDVGAVDKNRDDHEYRGDPAQVMADQVTVPEACSAAFPAPPAPTAAPATAPERHCYPNYAYWGSNTALRLWYRSFNATDARERLRLRADARRAHRVWKRSHPREAARVARRKAVCVDV